MNGLRVILRMLGRFLRDDRGQALTEYVVLTAMVACLCCYLYYPHNGIYRGMRWQYDLINLLLVLPGP